MQIVSQGQLQQNCCSVCCEPNILEESQEDTYEDLL